MWNSQPVKYITTNGLSSNNNSRIEDTIEDTIDTNKDQYDINEGSVSGGLDNYISEQVVIKVENDKSRGKNDEDSDDNINIDQMYEFVQNANDFDAIKMNVGGATQTAMSGEETVL